MKHFSHQDGVSDAQEAYPTAEPLESENTTYNGIGAELYAARLRAGLELADVSQRLRIRLQHLESIERGAFDEIPGRIYAIGFLRTYSEYLGFDGDDIVNRFKAETGGGAAPAKLVFPSPAPESRMPGTAIIFVALILAGAAYGAWYYMHDIQRIATELVSEVPERLTTEADTATGSNVFASTTSETDTSAPAVPMTSEDSPSATAMTQTDQQAAEADSGPMAASEPMRIDEPALAEPKPEPETPRDTATAEPAQQDNAAPSPQPAPSAVDEPDTGTTETMTATTAPTETPEQMEPATERMAALPTPSQPVTASEPVTAMTDQADDTVSKAATATAAPVTVEQAPPPPPTAPASQAFGDSNAPQEYGISNTDARVVLRARYDCWVQVRGTNDEQFLTKVLRAGDTYHVPNRADVRLYASDAGALEVLVDGRPIPPIGGPGEIVRDISLEARMLLKRG
jgi:cytoskeleton protein RodZ